MPEKTEIKTSRIPGIRVGFAVKFADFISNNKPQNTYPVLEQSHEKNS
jgi:hypothetical protein